MKNYFEDHIIFAPTFHELLARLKELFALLTSNGVKLNLSKCTFGLKVTFLGHRISAEGSQPDPKNIEAVMKMKPPTNVREVRRFLGMCGFYCRHAPSFVKVATPLTNLTRSNTVFAWTEECQRSFEHLKNSQVSTPILVKAQVDQPFTLTTDASDTHVGSVLSQLQPDEANRPID